MDQQIATNKKRFNESDSKLINVDQFNQIADAIIAGKYSWACLLLLRFSGHNPLHYIPYRTYNRIVKDNHQVTTLDGCRVGSSNDDQAIKANSVSVQRHLSQLTDLAYLETISEQSSKTKGGSLQAYQNHKHHKHKWLAKLLYLNNKLFR